MEDFFRFFTERQKEVYKLREQKMTFVQIGNTLGISKNAARQHYQNALRRIREYEAYNRMVEHNNQPVDFPPYERRTEADLYGTERADQSKTV